MWALFFTNICMTSLIPRQTCENLSHPPHSQRQKEACIANLAAVLETTRDVGAISYISVVFQEQRFGAHVIPLFSQMLGVSDLSDFLRCPLLPSASAHATM